MQYLNTVYVMHLMTVTFLYKKIICSISCNACIEKTQVIESGGKPGPKGTNETTDNAQTLMTQ